MNNKLSNEEINMIKNTNSIEELESLLKEKKYDLNKETATKLFNLYHTSKDLSDEELENVTGGTCYSEGVVNPKPGYDDVVRPYVIVTDKNVCPGWEVEEGYQFSKHCEGCKHHFDIDPTQYCGVRWYGHEYWDSFWHEFRDGECNW